jgi:hypothetical protein
MKKLLSLLFALVMVISLATPVLAQSGDRTQVQATSQDSADILAKKKHHKKKRKHPQMAQSAGAYLGTSSVQL